MSGVDAVPKFREKLQQQWYREAACGRKYVQVDALTDWMRTNSPSGKTNASRLLTEVMENHPRQHFWDPLLADLEDQDACLVLFAILLELDHSDLIDIFLDLRIRDKSLPILTDNQGRIKERLNHHKVENAEDIVRQFSKLQWAYCPVKLKLGMQGRFYAHESGSRVLPFCARQPVNDKGGTAEICEVSVEGNVLDTKLREAISEAGFSHRQYNRCYQMAVKTFQKEDEDVFEREKQAFIALRNHEGMVQYLGSFTHQEAPDKETHNLLLEYGEFDLIEFFSDFQPPGHPLEIIKFWEELLKVAQALKRMHRFAYQTTAGSSKLYYGWHSDIKPDNILRVRGEYKLADFGFSLFKEKKAGDSEKVPATFIEGHTRTYGPPEIDYEKLQSHQFSQGIDIWSLGTVLSMAATWVVHGAHGIRQFQELRERDIKNLRAQRDLGRALTTPSTDDSFHDGKSVLGSVRKWHQYLRLTVRKNDFITLHVLDLVERFMLLENPNSRIKSEKLCERLQILLQEAKSEAKNTSITIDETVLSSILSVDTHAEKETIQRKAHSKTQRANESHSQGSLPGIDGVPQTTVFDEVPGTQSKQGKQTERRRQFQVSKLAHPEVLQDGLGEAAKNAWYRDRLSLLNTENELAGNSSVKQTHPMPNAGPPMSHKPYHQGPSEWEPYQSSSQSGEGVVESTKPAIKVDTHYDGKEVSVPPAPTFAVPEAAAGTVRRDSPLANRQRSSFNSPSVSATAPGAPIPEWYSWEDVHHGLNVHRVRTELDTSRKGFMNKLLKKSKKPDAYRKFINNRDIKFIVDNGITMRKYWRVATFTLTTLGMILAALDDDGVDLHFTMNPEYNLTNVRAKSMPSKFENAMEKAQPPPLTMLSDQPCETDMNDVLGDIFGKYLEHLKHNRWTMSKRMTLIILTDGIWGGTKEKHETVEDKIGKFIKSVSKSRGEMEERQFSIEFVAFGDNPEGIQLLRELDDESSERVGIRDMIDTVHWTGPVSKMILGSIRDGMDDEEEGDPFMSPRTTNSLSPHNLSASNTLDVTSQHIARSNSHNSKNSRKERLSQLLSGH